MMINEQQRERVKDAARLVKATATYFSDYVRGCSTFERGRRALLRVN